MASVTTIGAVTGTNVTSLSITTGVVPAGGSIFLGVGSDTNGFDVMTDSVGNNYQGIAGSQSGVGAFLIRATNILRLPNNSVITIALDSGAAFNARMAAIVVSGLVSGAQDGSSAGQGTDRFPVVALDTVPINDYAVCVTCVAGPSTDGFTQDANYTTPGTLNTQTTTVVSVYFGYHQYTGGGQAIYRPTLGVARAWSALMTAIKT